MDASVSVDPPTSAILPVALGVQFLRGAVSCRLAPVVDLGKMWELKVLCFSFGRDRELASVAGDIAWIF